MTEDNARQTQHCGSVARKRLDLDSLRDKKEKSRIFGNIDVYIKPLSCMETISLVWDDLNMSERLGKIFECDSTFLSKLRNENATNCVSRKERKARP